MSVIAKLGSIPFILIGFLLLLLLLLPLLWLLLLLLLLLLLAFPYRAACATRGTRSGRRWPGDRGGNCPACLRPTPALSGMRAGRCANAPARHLPVVTTGFPPGPCALASGCAWHGRLLSSKWKVAVGKLPSEVCTKRRQVFTLSDWQDVWSFLRTIRTLAQPRSLGSSKFAVRDLAKSKGT